MKATGIVRKIDETGRFVLPMELRKKMGLINPDDALEVFVEGDKIVLRKYEASCIFCESMKDIVEYEDKKICRKCFEKIGVLFDNKQK